MRLVYRPIGNDWPGELRPQRDHPPFGSKTLWGSTTALLMKEVRQLQTNPRLDYNIEIVVQVALDEAAFRIDGGIRANVRGPAHPGVIVSFPSVHGPLRYATDQFMSGSGQPGWQWNVRAVAASLEALRKVDRYGVAGAGQQYTGWKQIGTGSAQPMGAPMSRADAMDAFTVELVNFGRGPIIDLGSELADSFRFLARHLHPDLPGGDAARFAKIAQARDVLED